MWLGGDLSNRDTRQGKGSELPHGTPKATITEPGTSPSSKCRKLHDEGRQSHKANPRLRQAIPGKPFSGIQGGGSGRPNETDHPVHHQSGKPKILLILCLSGTVFCRPRGCLDQKKPPNTVHCVMTELTPFGKDC